MELGGVDFQSVQDVVQSMDRDKVWVMCWFDEQIQICRGEGLNRIPDSITAVSKKLVFRRTCETKWKHTLLTASTGGR